MSTATVTTELVLLRGASLLHAATLQTIATLGDDGMWRTPDGAITDAIGVPQQAAAAIVKPADQRAADRAQDAAWIEHALQTARAVATVRQYLTVDDLWATVKMPPRKPRVMSTLIVAARREGLIEKTDAHRPSIRPINGGRTVRVWKSLIYLPGRPGA
jgi:hypothetical protein